MDRYIGKRLEGRYDILELIGKGGMANVYRAHDIIDDRTVAVKILRDEFMNNADFVRRFKNESKAIALLNHPNIVRVYDVSFSDTQSIVMEYIDGVTLKEYIEHTGPLLWKDALHFSTQILHALQHAHDKGIVHRDIKPQNIMLLRSGEIKVTDFGIARFARSESHTISDRAIGSVHYISPEQALGENTDDKSDIYSTGIMLYEMLTGELPFEADTAVSVAIKQIQNPIQNPREVNPSIPVGLEEITLRAVQKDPKNRFQSAAEMIAALDQFYLNPEIEFGYTYPNQRQGQQQHNETPQKERGRVGRKNTMSGTGHIQKNRQRSSYLRMLLVVTIAVVLGSAGFMGIMLYMNNPFVKTDDAKLPNLIGQRLEDLETLYPDFEFILDTQEYSNKHNKGVIFDQKPKAGMYVKKQSTVRLWVSMGQREITIPDLKDMGSSRVINELREIGLDPVQERKNHDTVTAGRVISLDPPENSVVAGGSKVIVYVSEGPEKKNINIPDFTNISREEAIKLLEERDFTLGSVTEQEHDSPRGTVISQNPLAGSIVLQDTPIDLVISKEGLTKYFIEIPLPTQINREITIRARTGTNDRPEIADEITLNPSESATGYWNPTFSGKEEEEIRIVIYVDGVLYQEYVLYFEDGGHDLVRDRSKATEFQK